MHIVVYRELISEIARSHWKGATYNKSITKTTCIIIKILIKQNFFQMHNFNELILTIDGEDIERVNQFNILGFFINLIFKLE